MTGSAFQSLNSRRLRGQRFFHVLIFRWSMKIFGLTALLFLCIAAAAQQPASVSSNGSFRAAEGGSGDGASPPRPGGKVLTLPSEKARPMNVPKTASQIVIDGKIDEDA